ncbi:hypothetical protein PoB_001967500 [Plakobranchus ocellatus]|uniref:Uncharacterized protein n=1 Tax=Plakobranchus ocellatus TaxID=259542 RepID=A0AAV3ZC58_9GAST|nr:hypothetical protein PoB_001967500 [Plakobranchus ocellatus]
MDTSPYRLYLAVAGGVAALIVLVLSILYCHLLRSRRKGGKHGSKSARNTMGTRDADGNLYVDPYHVGERLYGSSSPHFGRSDITYAKPVVYSTYLNPTFYEDAYERWRRQEQLVSEKLYDSPWLKPRGLQKQMETQGFRWSQNSLKTIGESRFKKLPRAQLSIDHASIRSNASIGSSSRPRDPLRSQSTSIASCEIGMLRLYPSMAAHDIRASQPCHMTSHDDVLTEDSESLSGEDMKSTDGLTNL